MNMRSPVLPKSKTVLTPAEEEHLVKWVTDMAKIGYGRTKPELLHTVKQIMDADGRINLFANNRLGKD